MHLGKCQIDHLANLSIWHVYRTEISAVLLFYRNVFDGLNENKNKFYSTFMHFGAKLEEIFEALLCILASTNLII